MMEKVERNTEVCALHEAGLTQRAIGRRLGISHVMVHKIIKRAERRRVDALCLSLAAAERGTLASDMQALWSDGVAVRDIAERLGRKISWVTDFIRQNRDLFPIRNASRDAIEMLEGAHPLVREIIITALDNGMTLQELCDRAGISRNTVLTWRHGAEPRLPMLSFASEAAGLKLALVPIEREAA